MAEHYVADGDGVRVYVGATPRAAKDKALDSIGWNGQSLRTDERRALRLVPSWKDRPRG